MDEFKTLGTPDRVIPDRLAKGKLIPGKTIPGRPPRLASKKTKLHVKAFLHLLFESAMKWKIIPMQRASEMEGFHTYTALSKSEADPHRRKCGARLRKSQSQAHEGSAVCWNRKRAGSCEPTGAKMQG